MCLVYVYVTYADLLISTANTRLFSPYPIRAQIQRVCISILSPCPKAQTCVGISDTSSSFSPRSLSLAYSCAVHTGYWVDFSTL